MSGLKLADSEPSSPLSGNARGRDDDDDDDDDDDYDESDLPFPQPLMRSSFLQPNFHPVYYLTSLSDRHQTLSDLQSDLRELSQTLHHELLNLVNENYTDLLSLGPALKGNDERVEEARIGLLGFRKNVEAVRGKVDGRVQEMAALLAEKKQTRSQIAVACDLLEIDETLGELEHRLLLTEDDRGPGNDDDDEDDDLSLSLSDKQEIDDLSDIAENELDATEDEQVLDDHELSLRRLEATVRKYLYALALIRRIGETHPFVNNSRGRLGKIESNLLLDLKTAHKQTLSDDNTQNEDRRRGQLSRVTDLYSLMGRKPEIETAMEAMKI